MDDRQLEDHLQEMNEEYENLPEFVDKRQLIQQIQLKRKQPLWKRVLPSVAAIGGLVLFIVLTMTLLDSDGQQAGVDSSEVSTDEEKEEREEKDEQEELETDEIEEYLLEAKEAFREELGIADVDFLQEVGHAEEIVNLYSEKSISKVEAKNWIDETFKTPKSVIQDMRGLTGTNSEAQSVYLQDSIYNLYAKLRSFSFSADQYLGRLLSEHQIDAGKQHELLKSQLIIEEYDGPQALVEFVQMIQEQGYQLARHPEKDQLYVTLNQDWIQQEIDTWEIDDLYKRYTLLLTGTLQLPDDGSVFSSLDRYELRNNLVEIEELIHLFEGEVRDGFGNRLFYDAANYLNVYLNSETRYNETISEEVQEEYQAFITENPESKFTSIVHQAVAEYEENDWKQTHFWVDGNKINLMFQYGIDYTDIISIDYRPLHQNPINLYKAYQETLDEKLLDDLSAFDAFSLYLYALLKEDEETYISLHANDSMWNGVDQDEIHQTIMQDLDSFSTLAYETWNVIKEEDPENELITYSFVDGRMIDEMIRATVDMKKENGIWKIAGYSIIQE